MCVCVWSTCVIAWTNLWNNTIDKYRPQTNSYKTDFGRATGWRITRAVESNRMRFFFLPFRERNQLIKGNKPTIWRLKWKRSKAEIERGGGREGEGGRKRGTKENMKGYRQTAGIAAAETLRELEAFPLLWCCTLFSIREGMGAEEELAPEGAIAVEAIVVASLLSLWPTMAWGEAARPATTLAYAIGGRVGGTDALSAGNVLIIGCDVLVLFALVSLCRWSLGKCIIPAWRKREYNEWSKQEMWWSVRWT